MDTKQNRNTKEKVTGDLQDGNNKLKRQGQEELQAATKQLQVPTSMTAPASPPSASSSPSHEFSFTICLHSSSTPVLPDKASKAPSPPSFAIDLSPADDIFFHGQLLPLHLLSHLPASPRSSTNSLDSFTLPIKELLDDQKPTKTNNNCSSSQSHSHSSNIKNNNNNSSNNNKTNNGETKARNKPKSFSLFRWKKECEVRDREDNEKQKKKLRFEVSQLLKRYARMVRPLLFFKRRKENHLQFHRQPYSFSGNLSLRNKQELRGRRGQYSAPASMRTSPTNSGLLVATATLPASTSDSTMEELQAAIQAAIAHCKNSIAAEEKIEC